MKVIIIVIIYVTILLAAVCGWGLNVYKLTQLDFEPSYKAEILRTVGLIPPVGAIMGWITLDEDSH